MSNTIILNDVSIALVVIDGQKYVPIRPVCKAIGIGLTSQFRKIKQDEILQSYIKLMATYGANGKKCKMSVIPLKYVFGWLFTINPKNVNPEISKNIVAYRMECYNALFDILQNEMY